MRYVSHCNFPCSTVEIESRYMKKKKMNSGTDTKGKTGEIPKTGMNKNERKRENIKWICCGCPCTVHMHRWNNYKILGHIISTSLYEKQRRYTSLYTFNSWVQWENYFSSFFFFFSFCFFWFLWFCKSFFAVIYLWMCETRYLKLCWSMIFSSAINITLRSI